MAEHDESLEVGLAAGLDVPTALAISEADKPRPRPGRALAWLLLAGSIAVVALWWLSR
jgi:hypothetical protein